VTGNGKHFFSSLALKIFDGNEFIYWAQSKIKELKINFDSHKAKVKNAIKYSLAALDEQLFQLNYEKNSLDNRITRR
jgi:hypothetical protein